MYVCHHIYCIYNITYIISTDIIIYIYTHMYVLYIYIYIYIYIHIHIYVYILCIYLHFIMSIYNTYHIYNMYIYTGPRDNIMPYGTSV